MIPQHSSPFLELQICLNQKEQFNAFFYSLQLMAMDVSTRGHSKDGIYHSKAEITNYIKADIEKGFVEVINELLNAIPMKRHCRHVWVLSV